jgi:hypothetical protein
MICPKDTIDSNVTGLRFAWERCLKQLWPTPIWNVLEPNSYSDFGATITTTARNPINPSRSRKKGTVTDLDAAGGFNQDLTQTNLLELSQAFFFATARQRGTTRPLSSPDTAVTSVTALDDTYTFSNMGANTAVVAAGGAGYRVGDILTLVGGTLVQAPAVLRVATVSALGAVLTATVEERGQYGGVPANPVATTGGTGAGATFTMAFTTNTTVAADQIVLASGFGIAGNNGLKTVVSMVGGVLTVNEALTDEAAPPAAATLQAVGYAFGAGDLDITMNGGLVRLTATGTAPDLSTLGLIPGEWVFVGGDAAGTRFANNAGFARVSVIDPDYLELDKVDWTPVAEVGAAVSLQMFFGTILRNETDPALIVHKPVQLERTLGEDTDGTMSEYLVGATANEMTLNVAQASICTVDLSFVGCDMEQYTGLQGLKTGTRPALEESDAYNSADSLARVNMSIIDPVSATPTPLAGHFTDVTLTVNNNVSPNKAVGTLGAIGTTAGTFEVGGELTAYFTSIAGPRAVRNNSDVTVDYVFVKDNAGMVWDIPLLALGNGAIAVEQDQPITLPLETNAAQSKFGHTLLMQNFPYLPDIAG